MVKWSNILVIELSKREKREWGKSNVEEKNDKNCLKIDKRHQATVLTST